MLRVRGSKWQSREAIDARHSDGLLRDKGRARQGLLQDHMEHLHHVLAILGRHEHLRKDRYIVISFTTKENIILMIQGGFERPKPLRVDKRSTLRSSTTLLAMSSALVPSKSTGKPYEIYNIIPDDQKELVGNVRGGSTWVRTESAFSSSQRATSFKDLRLVVSYKAIMADTPSSEIGPAGLLN